MNDSTRRWISVAFLALAALGFLLPLWPLSLLAVALLGLWGQWAVTVLVGLLLDLAWGAPVGAAHFLYFPFTLAAVLAVVARLAGSKYFIDRDLPGRL